MKIVLFTHPSFMKSKSMPRFAAMLESGYTSLGYTVDTLSPSPYFYRFSRWLPKAAKWLGYLDQYLLFPLKVKARLMFNTPSNTVFVFCDQALGPWVPLVSKHPHVIHVHDLLALKSALGREQINKTGWSGKIYQRYIRRGFEKGKYFISISNKTKADLEDLSDINPTISEVVFNGLNYPYTRMSEELIHEKFIQGNLNLNYKGYLFNIGGNQWYKNRTGLLHLYKHYIGKCEEPLCLVIVGPAANEKEQKILEEITLTNKAANVLFLKDIDNILLNALYSGAKCLIFPSHEEGFGWPIIEAQAAGTCVLTTNSAPMNEIAGEHSILFSPTEHFRDGKIDDWARINSEKLSIFLDLPSTEISELETKSVKWADHFDEENTLNKYISIYKKAL